MRRSVQQEESRGAQAEGRSKGAESRSAAYRSGSQRRQLACLDLHPRHCDEAGQFRVADLSRVAVESEALRGVVAVVKYAGPSDRVREELQTLIKSLGGEVHANPTAATTHIISADERPGRQWARRS